MRVGEAIWGSPRGRYGAWGSRGCGSQASLTRHACPRSSKPSWADQVEEEVEDGECARGPRVAAASPGPATAARPSPRPPAPALSPPSDPAVPFSQPLPRATLPWAGLSPGPDAHWPAPPPPVPPPKPSAAPLLRGGGCNSLPPALCQRPDAPGACPCLTPRKPYPILKDHGFPVAVAPGGHSLLAGPRTAVPGHFLASPLAPVLPCSAPGLGIIPKVPF